MTVEFNLKDFCFPGSILKLRYFFEKSQWFTLEQFDKYQENKLSQMINHVYFNVPYYKELFNKLNLLPQDIKTLSDLQKLPLLTKEDLRTNFLKLQASNKDKFSPKIISTSGTSGEKLSFLMDRHSNVLEFVYYWRYWNWAGYHIGNGFAEFTSYFFMKRPDLENHVSYFQSFSNRLMLNSLSISLSNIEEYVLAIRKYKPLFLKGLPSVLYYFALFLRERGIFDILFKAVFSTGEMLLDYHRKIIEETFSCKVYDSYGHMERTVAISECPKGGLHINSDYGLLEIVDRKRTNQDKTYTGKVVGTSFFNFSMPFIRYDVGDIVEFEEDEKCLCGRNLPVVKRINGRHQDIIITPDGKVITTLFIVFNEVPGIVIGQIIQESIDKLIVKIVKNDDFTEDSRFLLTKNIKKFVGENMKIEIEILKYEDMKSAQKGKFRTIISNLSNKMNIFR